MNKTLWNDGWFFYKAPFGMTAEEVKNLQDSFAAVNIPHDWLIYQGTDLYQDGTGFYKKVFEFKKEDTNRYEIYFEGVYMDTTVYVNGEEAGCWKYGYSSFFFDITNLLKNGTNEVLVKVDHKSPNTRWYSGAGIYRNVWFIKQPATHFVTDSFYISAKPCSKDIKGDWVINVSAEITGGEAQRERGLENYLLRLDIPELEISESYDAYSSLYTITDEDAQLVKVSTGVHNPELWSLENAKLYKVSLSLIHKKGDHFDEDYEKLIKDSVSTSFGFRKTEFTTEKGFFLNDKHIKIYGACEHHDLGALGAAFNKEAMRRELLILRDMGINAVRTAHNMPAPGLLELTDEMGFLVMDEAFDMWEWPKTEFDYARFFKEWQAKDVSSWIRRDRNHPSVIMWSIGNEIYDTHESDHGQDITRMLMTEARKADPECNAVIAMGSNYMAWDGAKKCADILKFAGYNYAERLYDEHHEKYPDWVIFGSETSSTLQSRGVYHFPYSQPGMTEIDEQCSCLGNCTATWGSKNSETNIIMDRDREYSLGQFIWSGFDYIGEPTPYQTRNSYFGQIDTAGFFKDTAYLYRAAWTDPKQAPFVHIFPYWDFNEGQMIDVRVASNAAKVCLYVNGRALEAVKLDRLHGDSFTANYRIPYENGELTAVAYDEKGKEIARDVQKSFGAPVRIKAALHYSKSELTAGCGDMAFIEITTLDNDGNEVRNDNSLMHVDVTGAGWLAGLDNGDSTDVDEYKGYSKRLFGGKLLAMVAAGYDAGEIKVQITSKGLEKAEIVIPVKACDTAEKLSGFSLIPEVFAGCKADAADREIRKIELVNISGRNSFDADFREVTIAAVISPAGAKADLEWYTVTNTGISTPLAEIIEIRKENESEIAVIKARGDGEFRVRCATRNGQRVAKVISELEFTAEGIGQATMNPYELVYGAMHTRSEGELGNAIEHGVASADGRSVIAFDKLDFGDFGSDEISVPIFETGGNPCPIEIWEGMPGEAGAEKLYETVYQKPSIWNTYQADTYKLPRRIKGITTVALVFNLKVMVGGIRFKKYEKAFETLTASERSSIFGDSFCEDGTAIRDIGNNVSIEFAGMDFGEEGATKIEITGKTQKSVNTIHILFGDEGNQTREIIEFTGSDEVKTLCFDIEKVCGQKTVSFIFLPGSQFDLESFRFMK